MIENILQLAREAIEDDKLRDSQAEGAEAIYPCDGCGVMRTKAQGGTTFTVCDACWLGRYSANLAAEVLRLRGIEAERDALKIEVARLGPSASGSVDLLEMNLKLGDQLAAEHKRSSALKAEIDRLLAAMTSARDEACEIAEAATHAIDNTLCVRCRSMIDNVDVEQIDALRAVGKDPR